MPTKTSQQTPSASSSGTTPSAISFNYDTVREIPLGCFSEATQSQLKHLSSVYF